MTQINPYSPWLKEKYRGYRMGLKGEENCLKDWKVIYMTK